MKRHAAVKEQKTVDATEKVRMTVSLSNTAPLRKNKYLQMMMHFCIRETVLHVIIS